MFEFLGRQNIAFRGHDETDESSNKGNLLQLFGLMSRSCPDLKQNLESKVRYTIRSSQNTVIKLIGDSIQSRIVAQVSTCGVHVFGVIRDETVDLSKVDQLSVDVRYMSHSAFSGILVT